MKAVFTLRTGAPGLDSPPFRRYVRLEMADQKSVQVVADRIVEALTREFPGVTATLDFETERGDHEDAFLWITADTKDSEEINDIWGYSIKLVQDAYNEDDVYLVARMKGVGVIDRERSADADF